MKVVILAGGLGTRLQEETTVRPKPMVEIGGRPMLWHIMNLYGAHGLKEFVLALGYKADFIRSYFLGYRAAMHDSTIRLADGHVTTHGTNEKEDWTVHLIDTGLNTQTGGRVRRLKEWIGNETFCLTYGDGVGDVDITALIAFHKSHGKLATVTAVRPPARFGSIALDGDEVRTFAEKTQMSEGWINGGFFVLEPQVLDYIEADETLWERDPLERLASEGQLRAFRHERFWQSMDTLRDVHLLESLWAAGSPPWRTWK
ncbi:MAG: glucose-1-phosphate cytidylyltransferase [Gemmatimonadetes bacterium]|nr:glucose-1-phosphate cytidylyltransferase [Gemmatimonadota bacterium]